MKSIIIVLTLITRSRIPIAIFILVLLGAGCAKKGAEVPQPAPTAPAPALTPAPVPAPPPQPPPDVRPDLTVTLESKCGADGSLQYTVAVRNRGNGVSSAFATRLVATKRDLTSSSVKGTSSSWTAEGLEPRKQLTYTGTIPVALLKSEDITSLRVKVDTEEAVVEVEESNNQKEAESACERLRPDLSVRIEPACSSDGSVSYTVTVKNLGNAPAGAFLTKGIAIKRDGTTPAAAEASMEWSAETLSSGGTLNYSATLPAALVKAEEITAVRVKTDAQEVVVESDENNNQREVRAVCE